MSFRAGRGQRLPSEIPASWYPGQQLYNRQRAAWHDPLWAELSPELRRAWGECERYIARRVELAKRPQTPLPVSESAVERYVRHRSAVLAVLHRLFADDEPDLMAYAEEILAAADTGI